MNNTLKSEHGMLASSQGEYNITFFWWRDLGKIPVFCSCIHLTLPLCVFVPPVGLSSISLVLIANTTLS